MSGRRISPTSRRRRLGLELRRLREASGLTGDDVAKRLGWSVSKISRIEKARAAVPWGDVSDLLDLYGMDESDTRKALIQLARDSKQQAWWQPYNDVLASFRNLATYIDLESAAESVRMFTPLTVPGLLQTESYARGIITTAGPLDLTEEEIERRVELRMRRQSVISEDPALELWVILDEAVLHRVVGDQDTMASQLHHLADCARHPKITIQVIPFSAGAHAAMAGAFSIFSFMERDDPEVAYVETVTGTLYLDRNTDLRAATICFDHLRAAALTASGSLELIMATARDYK